MWVIYLKQPLTPPERKTIVAYRTLKHRLAIESGWWTTIPISRGTRFCHFCSHNVVQNEAPFVLNIALYNPIIYIYVLSLFENVVLGSLKSFFQLDHDIDICLYIPEVAALHHSKKLEDLNYHDIIWVPLAFTTS